MKAIVIEKPGKVHIVEREMPKISSGQVLLKVRAAGICGSDVHIYHGKNAFATYPRVVGHEFVGEVIETGSDVKSVHVGDHVAVDPVISCGSCYACRHDRHNVCDSLKVRGVHQDGGYQEYVAVEEEYLYQLPKEMPWEIAATVEPYSIGAQVAHAGELAADDTVLICGAGPIGLIILQITKMKGARAAILDIVPERLAKAKKMGADCVINGKTEDVLEAVMKFTDGKGMNLIYEATGNIHILESCIRDYPSQAGRVVVLGFSTEEFKLRQVDIMKRELKIIGSRLNNHRFAEVIDWFRNEKLEPKQIISHTIPFEKIEEGFRLGEEHPNEVLKVVLTF